MVFVDGAAVNKKGRLAEMSRERKISLERNTAETKISLSIDLDGTGKYQVDTGCGFLNHMLELFAKRTDENNQQLEVLTSGNLKQRIATYLLEHADNNNLVSLSMNREELALYLNTTRPSLSRTLLSLQEDGFIHLSSRKSIKILDAEALLYIE